MSLKATAPSVRRRPPHVTVPLAAHLLADALALR
jgi:hypothetical protein